MIKKMLVIALVAILSFSVVFVPYAQALTLPSQSKQEERMREIAREKRLEREYLRMLDEANEFVPADQNTAEVSIMSYEGETRLIYEGQTWSGEKYKEDWESGIFEFIASIALTILGSYIKVDALIYAAVSFYGLEVATSKQCEPETWYSNYYESKYAQVYDYYVDYGSYGWKTYYTSRNRYQYKHHCGWYTVDDGQYYPGKIISMNYTPDKDHAPMTSEYAPQFSDDNYLLTEAANRWSSWSEPGYEDWTTSTDPGDINYDSISDPKIQSTKAPGR